MKNWDLQSALAHLEHQESFQFLLSEIEQYLDTALEDMEDTQNLERVAGEILAYRKLLNAFGGSVHRGMV